MAKLWVALSVVMGIVALGGAGSAAKEQNAGGLASGDYFRVHTIKVLEGSRWVPTQAKDLFKLRVAADGNLQFCFWLVFDNGHSCSMEGMAVKTGPASWEYREKLETGDSCVMRITFGDGLLRLEDVANKCRGWYCGARGFISHGFRAQDRRPGTAKPNCDDE